MPLALSVNKRRCFQRFFRPMCAAMAQRQLVRKTGVNAKLVGKVPEKTQPDLESGWWGAGGGGRG